MPRRQRIEEEEFEELQDLIGTDLASREEVPSSGSDQGQDRSDRSGSPGDQTGDDPEAVQDDDPRYLIERRAKKQLEKRFKGLAGRVVELQRALHTTNQNMNLLLAAQVERDAGSVAREVEAAEAAYRKAIDEGDSTAQVATLRDLEAARDRDRNARDVVRRVRQHPGDPEPAGIDDVVEPDLGNLAQEWMDKHPWFDPDSDDKDSRIVNATSRYIANQLEVSPDDPRHFQELNRRLRAELPHRFRGNGRIRDDDDDGDLVATAGSSRMSTSERVSDRDIPADLRNVEVTKADLLMHKAMNTGLDWNKKEDRITILRLKQETDQAERNQFRGRRG